MRISDWSSDVCSSDLVAEGFQDLPAEAHLLDAPLAADPVHVVGAAGLVLGPHEIGQHVLPRPADIAQLAPLVVVAGLPAHVDHAVDRRTAAQPPAARGAHGAPVQPRPPPRAEAAPKE